jgi:iron-sulfur cluster repair protein YtfE (RIC family)
MKRHPELQPLSHHHHAALVIAQRLRRATAEDVPRLREEFLAFWHDDGAEHFREEEDVLLPTYALYADPGDERIVQMLLDHVRIRATAMTLERGELDLEGLRALGEDLARHVRLEEREIFPMIEAVLD